MECYIFVSLGCPLAARISHLFKLIFKPDISQNVKKTSALLFQNKAVLSTSCKILMSLP